MALPPLYSIKVFESVARLGNMSAAAVELHVTIGAVSQQVKALQDGLGVALLRNVVGNWYSPTSGTHCGSEYPGRLTRSTKLCR